MSKLSKSEPTYPYSILMQESKDMREKNIQPEIYREVKVTNNGWCVLDNLFPKPIENDELNSGRPHRFGLAFQL